MKGLYENDTESICNVKNSVSLLLGPISVSYIRTSNCTMKAVIC